MTTLSPAGVVLAAGAGTRLRPLTDLRPKALCPVGGRPLVDLALDRLAAEVGGLGPQWLAVNAHHHAARGAAGWPAEEGHEVGRALCTDRSDPVTRRASRTLKR